MSIELLSAAAGGSQNKFGLLEALNEGGFISWAIFVVLVIMSVGSFYILFTKLFEQQKVINQGKKARAGFWRASSLKEGSTKLEKNSAYKQLVDDGLHAQERHGQMTDQQEAHDYLHGSLARSEASINTKLNSGLAFLATVGATAPFVGLLGTVIGIYSALIKIGIAGQASIDAVAGPVGEALIMTALGLFVAVPAVLAYNWLQSRNKYILRDLNSFSNDLLAYMGSDGRVKPQIATNTSTATKPVTKSSGQAGGVQSPAVKPGTTERPGTTTTKR
ncbi:MULTISPECIES: MotA/TolQ/ExbB proton channel family protein [Novosphingopyxis]|mgnify:FL=1|uniref:MotA/TolQ/ExbB proton channel family protein n=1 Tax=Novosphingopyxis TaxID=2709686 RepID=UPI000C6957D9|nr:MULTISPECIES: MotA/TolQ/ExbB proton channel family protein [Novosphingopyxis]MAB90786.1 flagellar motor protein MotA [Planctomycetota bacterium]MAC11491.1 flagellar motor protein MotA [Sphingorhabdus sp.]MBH9536871.1 MotA/TolQ/ExbB proton channel family protein [Novosphingopyxis sp. YJ-S2-01]|tara:strand:- start:43 stop:870 length:828 start_codon:yes stop_codon:yes gene_type:complete